MSSDLSRAEQTGRIAAGILGLEVDVRTGLHEYVAGEEPYSTRAVGAALLSWLAGDLHVRVLGGESGAEVARRVFRVLDDLVQRRAGEAVLVVAHGGVIISVLGSIVPGRAGPPSGNNPDHLDRDIAGGAYFSLEHRPGGWRMSPSPHLG